MFDEKKYCVTKSETIFHQACRFVAGGVSSSARGPPNGLIPGIYPMFAERAKGSHVYDVDGNVYVDYLQHFGAIVLGHAHDKVNAAVKAQLEEGTMLGLSNHLEYKAAEKMVNNIPCADLVMFSNTGSEATSMALKTARAYTGKEKIIKFEGAYHGWLDWCMVDTTFTTTSMSGNPRGGMESSPIQTLIEPGIPKSVLNDIIVLPWNNVEVLENKLNVLQDEVAAVIIEPNGPDGWMLPDKGFLNELRKITAKHGILLIFDEMKTGFRLGLGGAQGYYKVTPDLATYGKAIANGFPAAAVVGKKEILNLIAEYQVSHNGTYNGNPISMAAVIATLTELEKPNTYENMFKIGRSLMRGIQDIIDDINAQCIVQGEPTIFLPVFSDLTRVRSARDAPRRYPHIKRMEIFWQNLLKKGVLNTPKHHPWFISTSHNDEDVKKTLEAVEYSMKETFTLC